jgi:hypothetical protein
LIEDPGPWGYDALVDNKIAAPLLDELLSWGRLVGARVILIRRRPRRRQDVRKIFLVNSTRGHEWISAFSSDALDTLLALDREVFDSEAPGDDIGPLYLVCTHGRHDQCCSVRGNPVAGELCSRFGNAAWECSHIGGDRFAANVVCLPRAAYFGRVEPDGAQRLIDDYERGVLDLDLFRGWASLPFAVQAAEIAVRRNLELPRIADVTADRWTKTGDTTTSVELDTARGPIIATVTVTRSPDEVYLTCRAAYPGRPPLFETTQVPAAS